MKAHFGRLGRSRAVVLREKIVLVAFSGLIAALAISIFVFTFSNPTEARQDQAIKPSTRVNDAITLGTVILVAPAENVKAGTKIARVPLREIFWPRNSVPEGAVRSTDEIKDLFTKVDLVANQPILRGSLTPIPPSLGLDDKLPEGHRAVTIEVSATTGVEGWATPGAHVDLLLTYQDAEERTMRTIVAVEDAVVLSYNGSTDRNLNSDREGAMARSISQTATVTLAVPFQDSLKIQTAQKMGTLAMALRNNQEVRTQGPREFTADDFRRSGKKEAQGRGEKLPIPEGFASFVDSEGNEQKFMLGGSRWHRTSN